MAVFGRPLADPLVEKLLVAAIIRINDAVKTEAQPLEAVKALRLAMGPPDKLAANKNTLDRLRDGVSVPLNPGEDARTVFLIEFDPDKQHLNDFTATNEYRVQGVNPRKVLPSCTITKNGQRWNLSGRTGGRRFAGL